MKEVSVEVRFSEHVGDVFRLPEDGELKWVGVWNPTNIKVRYYKNLVASKSALEQDTKRDWEGNWVKLYPIVFWAFREAGDSLLAKRDIAERLQYIFLSVGYEDGRKKIYVLPVKEVVDIYKFFRQHKISEAVKLTREMEIFEITWAEFKQMHEDTYRAYKDSLIRDVMEGEITGVWLPSEYGYFLRPEDEDEIEDLMRGNLKSNQEPTEEEPTEGEGLE